jgi:hypothetical protein
MTPILSFNSLQASAFHLTDDQLAALLAAGAGSCRGNDSAAETHLLSCELCTAELEGMRESLSIFREASVACANTVYEGRLDGKSREWVAKAQRPQMLHPAFWAAAAAMLLTAVLLPLQMRRPAAAISGATHSPTSSGESDEALLEDVNRDLAASVPSPMQALVDPTGREDSALLQMPIENSDSIAIAPSAATLTSAQRKN